MIIGGVKCNSLVQNILLLFNIYRALLFCRISVAFLGLSLNQSEKL